MVRKFIFLLLVATTAISCQFTETMVMQPDGSGTMSVEINLNEMMAFGGSSLQDSLPTKLDTIVYMKKFLEEKKDSIAQLSAEEQRKLKKLEPFSFHLKMDSEASEMIYEVSTSFKDVNQANDIMNGMQQIGNVMPDPDKNTEVKTEKDAPEIIGVNYSFSQNTFVRDAYIKDEKAHQREVDSMKQTEAFLGGSNYTLKYTFPRKIKSSSNPDATFSLDGKTLVIKKPFIDYFKNPDLLDLEVVLEEK